MIIEGCLKVQAGERVAILADTPNAAIGELLAAAAKAAGGIPEVAVFPPRTAHGENPPAEAAHTLLSAHAAVLVPTFSLASSQARRDATAAGVRIITVPACSEAVFASPAMTIGFERMAPLVRRLGAMLTAAKEVRISSDAGTDLRITLCGRKSVDQTGLSRGRGEWSPLPNIETAVGPADCGVNGVFAADAALIPGGVPSAPVLFDIVDGRIAGVRGGPEARVFADLLERYGTPNVKRVVELGFGLNPKSRMGLGMMAEDESCWGTVHLGIGEGRTFGIDNPAPAHVDIVMRAPTVTLDGETILRQGVYQIADFEEMKAKEQK